MEGEARDNEHSDFMKGVANPEVFYQTFFEYGNDGVFVYRTRPDGMPDTFIEVNGRACELLGYTREELLRRSPEDLVIPEKWDEVPEIVRRKRAAGGRLVFETTIAAKDGRVLEVEISDHSFERNGQPMTVSIVRDRTERRHAERQRALAMTVCTNTLNSIGDFVSVHDRNFRVMKVNKALAGFLGKDQNELVGKFCYEVFHGTSESVPGCPHSEALRTGRSATITVGESKVGSPLEITCSPYLDERGEMFGTVHIARDVSGLRGAEREKDKLIEELRLALQDVKQLSGLLPICCSCKKIRDDQGNWQQLEAYIRDRSEAEFSHGYCPRCFEKSYPLRDGM